MRILILGGTQFMGSFLTEALLARGDEVTVAHRGRSQVGDLAGATHVTMDRADGHEVLVPGDGAVWDAVVDTSGYVPAHVRDAAETLAPHAKRYVFVSSVSVYDIAGRKSADEKSPVLELKDRDEAEAALTDMQSKRDSERYGEHKVLSERAVTKAFGADRTTIVRPGLMAGPRDPTWRFGYWVDRIERGGEVLAPAPARGPIQYIDARDVANFIVTLINAGTAGTFNAVYQPGQIGFGGLIGTAMDAVGVEPEVTWADAAFLESHDVEPWTELPLWIPPSGPVAMRMVSDRAAAAAGLRCRLLADTVTDTLAWLREHGTPPMADRPTLTPERETELLAAWHAQQV